MSTLLLIIVAFWALLFVAYAIWPLFGKDGLGKRLPLDPEVAQRYNEQIAAATAALEQQMRGAATSSPAGSEGMVPQR